MYEGERLVERYELREVLGAGGMGVVHRAIDGRLDREVAVKVVDLSRASAADRSRFEREAQAVGRLRSEHVVTVHDVGEDVLHGGHVGFLVMELLEGAPLNSLLATQLPTVEHVITWGRQISHALHDAHAAGVIHRDVKPSNVIISAQGTATLIDFGIARLDSPGCRTLTIPGTVMGTPPYMAPERLRGEDSDERCDLYGLGCVLYELLTGRPPFGRGAARAEGAHPLPVRRLRPDVPLALEDLVADLLHADPAHRLDSAAAVRRLAALQPVPRAATVAGTAMREAATRTAPRRAIVAPPAAPPRRPPRTAHSSAASAVLSPPADGPAHRTGGGWPALAGAAGLWGQLSLLTATPGWAAGVVAAGAGLALWALRGPHTEEDGGSGGTVLVALAAAGMLSLHLAFWSRAPWWVALSVLVVAAPVLLAGCALVDRLVSRLLASRQLRVEAGTTSGMANAAVLVTLTGQWPVATTVTTGAVLWLLVALVAAAPGRLMLAGNAAGR